MRGAIAALLLALLLGCGGGSAEGEGPAHAEPPPPPLTDDGLLPSDAFIVVKLDLVRLRESSNWDVFEGVILVVEENLAGQFPFLGDGELRRWVGLTDRAWVGAKTAGAGDPEIFTVVHGRSTNDDVLALFERAGEASGFTRRADASKPTFDGEAPLSEVALLEDGLGVSTPSGQIGDLIARHESREGESPLANETMAGVAQRVNFPRDALGIAAVFTPEAKALIGPRLDARARFVLEAATAGALRVGVNEGIDALAIVTTSDPAVATAAVAEIERQRDAAARQPFVQMMGLGFLIDGIGANADGGDLRISLRAGHEDTRNLLGRVSGLVGMAIANMIAEGG